MDQHEFDTCREVLEYIISQLHKHEPHAVNTIDELEAALSHVNEAEDYEYEQ